VCDIFREWPGESVAQRRPFKALLGALSTEPGVTGFQALIRTPRAWYRWGFGRGRGPGPLDFDDGPEMLEAETAWRLGNCICVWLTPDAPRDAVAHRVAMLDQAIE
jgi:hypothetical protein